MESNNKSVRDEVSAFYKETVPHYKFLIKKIMALLENAIMDSNLMVSSIDSRIKEFDSLMSKVTKLKLVKKYEKIDDIAGIRVICLYRSDLPAIGKLIGDNLTVLKRKLTSTDESVFGYMSDHYVVRLPTTNESRIYEEVEKLKCEIQVRTVSMHSWALVSHHLNYKKELDIPTELKKDFNALSGVFYIADTLFDQFKITREKMIEKIRSEMIENKHLENEINYDSLDAYILWKFPDRDSKDQIVYSEHLSNLLNEITDAKLNKLKELDVLINKNIDEILNEEKKYIQENDLFEDKIYNGIGFTRQAIKKDYPEIYE